MKLFSIPLWVCSAIALCALIGVSDTEQTSVRHPVHNRHISPRSRRAPGADDFNSKADKVAMIARVLTAISLQNGLIDGSIPGDEAIAELLNIGSLDDVESFNKAKVDKFLENLKAVKNADKTSAGYENQIVATKEIRQRWSKVVGLEKLPDAASLDKLDVLKEVVLTELKKDIKTTLANIQSIANLPDDTATDKEKSSLAHIAIKTIQSSLVPLHDVVTFVKALKDQKNMTWGDLKTVSQNLEPLVVFGELVMTLKNSQMPEFSDTKTEVKEALKKNVALMGGLVFDSAEFRTIMSILTRRAPVVHKNTAGFVNGYRDLMTITDDSTNAWLLKALGTSLPIEAGLQPSQKLGQKAAEVDGVWPDALKRSIRESIQQTIQFQGTTSSFTKTSESTENAIQAFGKCGKFSVTALEPSLNVLIPNLKKLTQALRALLSMFELVTDDQIPNLEQFKQTMKMSSDLSKVVSELPGVIAKMKKFSGAQKAIDLITKLDSHLEVAKGLDGFNDVIANIGPLKPFVVGFNQNQDIVAITTFLGCLKSSEAQTSNVTDAVQFLKTLRESKAVDEVTAEIDKVSSKISQSQPILKDLRSLPATLKSELTEELALVKNLKVLAKQFGDATLGVAAIRNALGKKPSFETLVASLPVVDSEIGKLSDANLKKEVNGAWGKSVDTKKAVQDLLKELTTRATAAGRRKRELAGFGVFFSSLAGLQDVNLSIDKKLRALDDIGKTSTAVEEKVAAALKALEQIETLDLQFSRYNTALLGMPKTLAEIQVIFASATAESQKLAKAKAAALSGEDGGIVGPILGWLLYLFILFGSIGWVGYMYYYYKLMLKKERQWKQRLVEAKKKREKAKKARKAAKKRKAEKKKAAEAYRLAHLTPSQKFELAAASVRRMCVGADSDPESDNEFFQTDSQATDSDTSTMSRRAH